MQTYHEHFVIYLLEKFRIICKYKTPRNYLYNQLFSQLCTLILVLLGDLKYLCLNEASA